MSTQNEYDEDLSKQLEINAEQVGKLEDLLFVERIKVALIGLIAIFMFAYLIFVFYLFFTNGSNYLEERYSAIVNTVGVIFIFGIVEIVLVLISSIHTLRRLRRLIARHWEAIKIAHFELKDIVDASA